MSQVGYDWRGPDAVRRRPREQYEGVDLTRTVAAVVDITDVRG